MRRTDTSLEPNGEPNSIREELKIVYKSKHLKSGLNLKQILVGCFRSKTSSEIKRGALIL